MNKYKRNKDPKFWTKERYECNCGSFALNVTSWVAPYDNDEKYTEAQRSLIIRELYEEGADKDTILRTIIELDQESILAACPWLEPVLPSEINNQDRVVAYRLSLDMDELENGFLDDDYHFRVRINGFWFEKCGQEEIRLCPDQDITHLWVMSKYLIYDSDICFFRFKNL